MPNPEGFENDETMNAMPVAPEAKDAVDADPEMKGVLDKAKEAVKGLKLPQ